MRKGQPVKTEGNPRIDTPKPRHSGLGLAEPAHQRHDHLRLTSHRSRVLKLVHELLLRRSKRRRMGSLRGLEEGREGLTGGGQHLAGSPRKLPLPGQPGAPAFRHHPRESTEDSSGEVGLARTPANPGEHEVGKVFGLRQPLGSAHSRGTAGERRGVGQVLSDEGAKCSRRGRFDDEIWERKLMSGDRRLPRSFLELGRRRARKKHRPEPGQLKPEGELRVALAHRRVERHELPESLAIEGKYSGALEGYTGESERLSFLQAVAEATKDIDGGKRTLLGHRQPAISLKRHPPSLGRRFASKIQVGKELHQHSMIPFLGRPKGWTSGR